GDANDLDHDLDALVALNKNAMFAADRGTRALANRLVLGVLATLAILALVVAGTGWTLASAVARPLTELAARLRSVGPRGPYPALAHQPLAELEQVADEYRRMAERLEGFEQLNVEAVLDEKAKTEAVIESIDDGLVVLDPAGSVLHMNEVARAILGLEQIDVPGVPFDRLGSDHPHYLRLREAVRQLLAEPDREPERVELALFLRGRDHYYVLRPTPLRARDGSRAGLILALQDVTYLRDQEARFEQLVATLSHELGSPLTSLRMAVELLGRDDPLAPAPRALVDAAQEDVARLQDLAQRLLDLSRARATSIPLERRNVDLREVIPRTVKLFALPVSASPSCGTSSRRTAGASTSRARSAREAASRSSCRAADMASILIVDDEKNIRSHLTTYVRGLGHTAEATADAPAALAALGRSEFDVVFSDVRMAGMDGLALLHEIRRRRPEAVVVLMTAYATVAQAVEAVRAGAYDYLVKPFSLEQVGLLLARVLEVQTLKRENRTI